VTLCPCGLPLLYGWCLWCLEPEEGTDSEPSLWDTTADPTDPQESP
jgi:hypothetical protein